MTTAAETAAATGPEHGTEIRIEGLSKSFETKRGPLTAIDGLSLTIRAGSFFVVVGPSGCGKSTLLRLLAGLEKPSAGIAEIHGGGGDRPASSMVFQGESAFPWMTVFDNAAYGLKMRRVPAEKPGPATSARRSRTSRPRPGSRSRSVRSSRATPSACCASTAAARTSAEQLARADLGGHVLGLGAVGAAVLELDHRVPGLPAEPLHVVAIAA